MKKYTLKARGQFTAICLIAITAGVLVLTNSCNTRRCNDVATEKAPEAKAAEEVSAAVPLQQNAPQTKMVTIANIRKTDDGSTTEVMFNELAELFTVADAGVLTNLKAAFDASKAISVKFDPWSGIVLYASPVSDQVAAAYSRREVVSGQGAAFSVNLASSTDDVINNTPALAVLNTTTTGLTNVIPDMATAQLMFNYITKQCCALSGPYGVDYCISFQYCQDGCYARAHKMCWILNNRYKYATHKIFSFANSGSDKLCVQAQKWRGCCVRWWYHVAPIVNIKTPSGVKAYVFDPAMFNQPVLLATWLHAQENPACVPSGSVANVSMINIQPTSSYTPSGYSGYSFSTDPVYSSTNSTLISYAPLHTCY